MIQIKQEQQLDFLQMEQFFETLEYEYQVLENRFRENGIFNKRFRNYIEEDLRGENS